MLNIRVDLEVSSVTEALLFSKKIYLGSVICEVVYTSIHKDQA